MDTIDIAIVAAFVVAFSIISARLSTTVITGPMVFVLFGLIVGPDALNVVDLSLDNEVVRTLAELTLVLILYTDASRVDIGVLRRNSEIPLRLLVIAMPLTDLPPENESSANVSVGRRWSRERGREWPDSDTAQRRSSTNFGRLRSASLGGWRCPRFAGSSG